MKGYGEMRYLTFALAKGRLAKKTLALLEQIGITCEEMKDPDTRKLIFVNEELKMKFFLSKVRTQYLRREETCMRSWISVLESAACVYADRHLPESFSRRMRS